MISKRQKTIEIKNLKLVPYSKKHDKDIFKILNREICEKIGWPLPRTSKKLSEFLKNKKTCFWSIFLGDILIGGIFVDMKFRRDNVWEMKTVNLGYFLDEEYRNNGYVSMAVPEIIKFSFSKLGARRIIAGCLENNSESKKIIKRNGFKFVGVERNYAKLKSKNKFLNHYLYDLIK